METVPTKNNLKDKKVLTLLAANAVILAVITFFLFTLIQTQLITNDANKPSKLHRTPTPVPTLSINEITVEGEFVKRSYTPTSNFFRGYQYPVEMTDRMDEELLGFRCTPSYFKVDETIFYRDHTLPQSPNVAVIDQDVATLYDQLASFSYTTNNTTFDSFKYCELEDGRKLVIYHSDYEPTPDIIRLYESANPFMVYSYIGLIDEAGDLEQITPYYSFLKAGSLIDLLQINSNSNTLYIDSHWGDLGGGKSGIHRVQLDIKDEYVTLLTCATGDRDAGDIGSCVSKYTP